MAVKKPVLKSVINSGEGAPLPSNFTVPGTVPGAPAPIDTASLIQQMSNPAALEEGAAPLAAAGATGGGSLLARLLGATGGVKGIVGADLPLVGKLPTAVEGIGLPIAGSVLAGPAGALAQKAGLSQDQSQVVSDAIRDAGIGAGVASIVPGPGTLFGAGVGALFGAGKDLLFGTGKKGGSTQSVGDAITGALGGMGVSPAQAKNVADTYASYSKFDPASAQTWLAGQMKEAQTAFSTNGGIGSQASQEQNLVLQQLAGQAMAPYVNDMRSNLDSSANAVKISMGKNLTPEQSARMAPLVTQYANLSKNVADAYALQAEQFPIQNQLAKSAWATMLQASSGSGGGLTNLLAQTTPSTATPTAQYATT